MSLQISAHGTRDGVLKQVASEIKDLPAGTDKAQIEAVRALVTSEINSLPAEFNGARVQAEANAHGSARTVQVSIVPLKLHL